MGGVGVVTAIIFSGGIRRDIGIYILWFAGFDGVLWRRNGHF